MSTLSDYLTEVIGEATKRHTLPLYVTTVGANGYVLVVKISLGGEPQVLVEHNAAGKPAFPINIVVADQAGGTSRVLMGIVLQANGRDPQCLN